MAAAAKVFIFVQCLVVASITRQSIARVLHQSKSLDYMTKKMP